MTITLIDYGMGNLQSVRNALMHLGQSVHVARSPADISAATKLVFPGQGACGYAMSHLKSTNLLGPILNAIESGVPFLGICLGFQLLFAYSEEDGGQKTFGILPGTVRYFNEPGLKVPQMGWNTLSVSQTNAPTSCVGIQPDDYVYFVHSLYATGVPDQMVASRATYGTTDFVAAVEQNNVWGTQFHPEKSGHVGHTILRNFIAFNP